MSIRSLTSFSLLTVLALGLPACGDDKDPMVTASNTTNTNPTTNTTNTTPATTTDGTTDGTGTASATDAMTGTETTSEPETTTPTTTVPGTSTTEPATTTESQTSTTGTTVDPETSTTADTTTGGGGDGLYGPCGMGCPADSDCVSLDGVEGDFCSPKCGAGVMCPVPDGGAMGQCALILEMGMDPTNCAAICSVQMQNCPEGTTCKAVPMQMVGVCTAP